LLGSTKSSAKMRGAFIAGLFLLCFCLCQCSQEQAVAVPPFKWSVCDGAKGAVVQSLSLTPFPIVLGANTTLNAKIQVNQPLGNSTLKSIAIAIQKQVFGVWVDIPCVDHIGSCTYKTNLCDAIADNDTKTQICAILQPAGLPCQCPFAAGTYSAVNLNVPIPDPGLSWATDGNFYAKVLFETPNGKYACTEAYFSLKSKKGDENGVEHGNVNVLST